MEKKRYSVQEEHEKLKRMEHPSIVKYFEIKQHGEFMYLALEVCDSDLDDYIKTKAPSQTPRNLIDLFKQIALGIQYLHQENLIHRDIKPSNILVKEYKSGSCQPKLCDFGCAKQLEDGRIDYTDSLNRGSQGFVPQELLNEDFLQKVLQTIGKAADVFPLGCILHMLLSTGKHPFGDPVDRNSNIKHMKQAIIEIKLIHEAGIANEAEDLVARMIDHDPKERHVNNLINP